jgi:A/G-specific adenine glycosylase
MGATREKAKRPTRNIALGRLDTGGRSFALRLIAWQKHSGRRDLPWQRTRDPYRIWLSEIMLQQTQVGTVIPYYQSFLAAFPDVASLAAAPIERVLELWSGLGYYRRAHLAHRAARIVGQHDGRFPDDAEALAALPGIGRSTAAAIAAFASGARNAILDGNVKRVLARHRGIAGFPGDARVERQLWRCAEALLPQHEVATYTQAMMDLGATVCLRRTPRCEACPVARDCVARREGRIADLPAPRPKKALPRRNVTVLLVERKGEVLLERRPATGVWSGLWSLPEIETTRNVVAHCRSRFGMNVVPQTPLPAIEHAFTHFHLTLHPLPCTVRENPARAQEPGMVWMPLDEIAGAALPAPIKKLLLLCSRATSRSVAQQA